VKLDGTTNYTDLRLPASTPMPSGMRLPDWDATRLVTAESVGDLVTDSSPYSTVSDALSLRLVDRISSEPWVPEGLALHERGLVIAGPAGLVTPLDAADPLGMAELVQPWAPNLIRPLLSFEGCFGTWGPVTTVTGIPDAQWSKVKKSAQGDVVASPSWSNPVTSGILAADASSLPIERWFTDPSVAMINAFERGHGEAAAWALQSGTADEWILWRNAAAFDRSRC